MQEMDPVSTDLALQAILGRGGDFVGGIDNEALDFSQLEDFINSEGSQGNHSYFTESLNSTTTPATVQTTTGKLLNVIVDNTKQQQLNGIVVNLNNGHSLPDSPPDSSSEHPYSPQEGCCLDNNIQQQQQEIYTTLYKPTTTTTILNDNLLLNSHIVVAATTTTAETTPPTTNDLIVNNHDAANLLLTTQENNNYKNDLYNNEQQQQQQQNVYTNLQNVVRKKRKLSQDSLVKSEPEHCTTSQLSPPGNNLSTSTPIIDEEYASSETCLSESQYQCIRFNQFQQNQWHSLCDQNLTELPIPHYRVDADKGFNFSNSDDAFVCQKKNHFQITCHVQLLGDAQFVKTQDGFQKISSFHLHFYGVKHDCPTQTIRVEQSQSDRSKKPFHPVLVELVNSQVTKVTVGRLHFSETTSNNMRKKGKPNPEQRYFQLVVGLHAHTTNGNFPVISHASQKIIVRASNPGQFESDVELCWQKGQTQDSVFHNGKVGINMDRPDESLVVHGNIKLTGHIIQPSDIRAKKNIIECDTAEQLRNIQKLRVVRYEYEPNFATQLNCCNNNNNNNNSKYQKHCQIDTGVIAQEVVNILPEAVHPAGDLLLDNGQSIDNFLVVNKERIFMENIGAVKELCKVTDNLETRIDQLERINRRLNKLKRGDSFKSNSTVSSCSKHSLQKCPKHAAATAAAAAHCTSSRKQELCSNKFIQIVIVILVLIMAFCLAAITTLYLMEASRRNQLAINLQTNQQRTIITKYPIKQSTTFATATKNLNHQNWQHLASLTSSALPHHTTNSFTDITKITVDSNLIKRPSFIIGRPLDCLTVEQDLENSNLCQIYCCVSPPPPVMPPPELFEKKSSTNKSELLLNLERNKVTKPFHSNDIDKMIRQKRDTFDLNDDNSFDLNDDNLFTIVVQGRNFNTTLTNKYLLLPSTNLYNYSYSVPISKYMPDEYINLIFRSTKTNLNNIEYCFNHYHNNECPLSYNNFKANDGNNSNINNNNNGDNNNKKQIIRQKINENGNHQAINIQSVSFEIGMFDFQSKIMTYRVALKPNQNVCKLSAPKLGAEFIEYSFHFYRHCDE